MIHEERIIIRYYCYSLQMMIAMRLLQKNYRRIATRNIIEALPYISVFWPQKKKEEA